MNIYENMRDKRKKVEKISRVRTKLPNYSRLPNLLPNKS